MASHKQQDISFGQRKGLFDLPDVTVTQIKSSGMFAANDVSVLRHAAKDKLRAVSGGMVNHDTAWEIVMAAKDRSKLVKDPSKYHAPMANYIVYD